MKILACGDAHLTDAQPLSRLDTDFFSTQLTSLSAIESYVVKHGVRVVLFAGDLFDTRRVSNRVLTETMMFLARLKEHGVFVATILGQHDVRGHNTAQYTRDSDVYVLEVAGLLTVLRNGAHMVLEDEPIAVYGFGYGEAATKEFLDGGQPPVALDVDLHICMVHATVGSSKDNPYMRDINSCQFSFGDYVLFGDVHEGFDPVTVDDALAIGLGSISNMSISEADNKPSVLLIDTAEDTYRFLALPHPSKEEAFAFDTTTEKKVDISAGFKERLMSARQDAETDEEIVLRVAKLVQASQPAVERLLMEIKNGS